VVGTKYGHGDLSVIKKNEFYSVRLGNKCELSPVDDIIVFSVVADVVVDSRRTKNTITKGSY